jgi:hypothetical protein
MNDGVPEDLSRRRRRMGDRAGVPHWRLPSRDELGWGAGRLAVIVEAAGEVGFAETLGSEAHLARVDRTDGEDPPSHGAEEDGAGGERATPHLPPCCTRRASRFGS